MLSIRYSFSVPILCILRAINCFITPAFVFADANVYRSSEFGVGVACVPVRVCWNLLSPFFQKSQSFYVSYIRINEDFKNTLTIFIVSGLWSWTNYFVSLVELRIRDQKVNQNWAACSCKNWRKWLEEFFLNSFIACIYQVSKKYCMK